jgi:1-deoxy-D-xylulose-5-phosphate synthase
MNEEELRNLMYTAQLDEIKGPFVIRYPRGQGVMPEWKTPLKKVGIGTGRKVKSGSDIAILSIGHIGNEALKAAELLEKNDCNTAVYDMRFVKPLDELMLHEIFGKYENVITVEDGCIQGGFGSAVVEFMVDNGYTSKVVRLGIPDRIVEHGSQEQLYAECEYDADSIVREAIKMTSSTKSTKSAGIAS